MKRGSSLSTCQRETGAVCVAGKERTEQIGRYAAQHATPAVPTQHCRQVIAMRKHEMFFHS